ncbi:MAG: hypothetical protein IJZ72_09130 [Oscillospiraceae bacterium]|nr:hypothetical protein [Oscillospiraceae bacterium]
MKILKTAALLISAAMLMTGCAQVNEDVDTGEEAVYISPSVPEVKGNYPLSLLNDKEKQFYDRMVEAVNAYEEHISIEGADTTMAKKLFKLMYTQENRIFWVDSKYNFHEDTGVIDVFYRYTPEESAEMRAVLDFKAAAVLADMPQGASDYEKVTYLHDSIIKGCSFSKAGDHVNSAYGVIVDGVAQCEGYAFAMSYLCSSAGLENYVVTGTSAEGETHAWNKIFADGEWYNVDCTWDDPMLKRESKDYIIHDYMLVSDSEIEGISHFTDIFFFEPLPCTDAENNYFIREGLYCTDATQAVAVFEDALKKAVAENRCDIEIRIDGKDVYSEVISAMFDNGGLKKIIEKLNSTSGARIASAVKSVNDELLTIHVSLIYEGDE